MGGLHLDRTDDRGRDHNELEHFWEWLACVATPFFAVVRVKCDWLSHHRMGATIEGVYFVWGIALGRNCFAVLCLNLAVFV